MFLLQNTIHLFCHFKHTENHSNPAGSAYQSVDHTIQIQINNRERVMCYFSTNSRRFLAFFNKPSWFFSFKECWRPLISVFHFIFTACIIRPVFASNDVNYYTVFRYAQVLESLQYASLRIYLLIGHLE